jgi:NAD(P)-dependent dehydrogenase (short-subunit alcohol dehydrogenase family)
MAENDDEGLAAFLAEAKVAYERMFRPERQAELKTFSQRELCVYEVRPGVIATDMTGPVKAKYDKLLAEGLAPIRRWGQPEDVGACVAAVLRGDFPYSTGQVFDVDGGFHLQRL